MYAVTGPELAWTERPDPVPGPGEVRIAVAATALNRADLLQRVGLYPPPPGVTDVLGLECAGVVDAVGDGVELAVGTRVCALLAGGGYATHAVCPVGQVLVLPDTLPFEAAACLPEALCTAFLALVDTARLRPGDRVLWHAGASGIGSVGLQLLAAEGHRSFVTVGSADKIARCTALGADGGWNRKDGSFVAAARAWGAPDVIVDPVGYVAEDQEVLADDGRVVLLAFLGGREKPLDLARLLVKRQTFAGTTLRSRSPAEKARIVAGVRERWWPLVASGRVKAVIDEVLPIADAARAHERLAGDGTVGKIAMSVPVGRRP